MSIWNIVADKIKGIVNKMIGKKTIEQVLHVNPAMSNKMMEAIDEWTLMYEDKAPWLKEPSIQDPSMVKSLGIPQFIASEKARMALLEFESEITTPMKDAKPVTPNYMNEENIGTDGKPEPRVATHVVVDEVPKGPTDRAEYLNKQYAKLKDALRVQIEYGIAKGGLVIKPYVVEHSHPAMHQATDEFTGKVTQEMEGANYEIEFDYVQANEFFPLAFDASGTITEAAFVQRKIDKDTTYSRVEYHRFYDNTVQVINKAFKTKTIQSEGGDYLGTEIPLTEVPEWAALAPETTINDVDRLLFAYFKMPEANTIDTYSPLGVSGFDKAKGLIEEADKQYSRMLWEFEGGELAIDIDRDALRYMNDPNNPDKGHSVMPKLQQRLYRQVDLNEENTYNIFSPQLREASLINGLNTILMRIEDVSGLSRGTLSDVTTVVKTATELKIMKQRSFQTNAHIQNAIQKALKDTIYVMNVYCDLYNITKSGEYEVSFEWDDSIIADSDVELSQRILLIQNGLASKLETRMWYFGETERQAKEALTIIQQESLEAVEQNLAEMQMTGQTPESKKEESPKEEGEDNDFKSGDNQYS